MDFQAMACLVSRLVSLVCLNESYPKGVQNEGGGVKRKQLFFARLLPLRRQEDVPVLKQNRDDFHLERLEREGEHGDPGLNHTLPHRHCNGYLTLHHKLWGSHHNGLSENKSIDPAYGISRRVQILAPIQFP